MTSKFLTWATGEIEVPLTEMKLRDKDEFWRENLIRVQLQSFIQKRQRAPCKNIKKAFGYVDLDLRKEIMARDTSLRNCHHTDVI